MKKISVSEKWRESKRLFEGDKLRALREEPKLKAERDAAIAENVRLKAALRNIITATEQGKADFSELECDIPTLIQAARGTIRVIEVEAKEALE